MNSSKKTEPTTQQVTNGESADSKKTSETQSSEKKPIAPLPTRFTAVIYDLPARLQSQRSLVDILKDFPSVKYIDIKVLVNGIARITSKDPKIVSKLHVLKLSIKEPIVIRLWEPKKPYVKQTKKPVTKPQTGDKSEKKESDEVIPKVK
ncbi:hypothetical protein CBL_06932 [Carabus blaptoides fortunei]